MRVSLFFLLYLFIFNSYSQEIKEEVIYFPGSGIYKDSVIVTLSTDSTDKIYYSDNGDYPKKLYTKPLVIKKTTSIRVKKEKSLQGYTRNYIVTDRKVTLPIVCITVKPSDLFDTAKGIYAKGLNAKPTPPYFGANYHKDWERTCYVELIDTNNKVEFNQKFGIKIFGQFSAMLPQKSFSIHARKKYGKKKLKNQLFPDLPIKKYKSFILRNSGSDNCNTHLRDVMMTSLVKNFNLDVQAYRPCVVYLNGKYWGIYHLREKINEHFLSQHYGVDKDSVAILKHRYDVQHYGRINYKSMLTFINKTDLSIDSNINKVAKLMDIDNYLDYNIAQVYFNNIDAGGNIRYWRERKKGGKWRWILFDTDFGFGLSKKNGADENSLKRFTEYSSEGWPHPSWSTLIIRNLLENDSIKEVYIKKLTHYLNTTFESTHVKNHINFVSNQIKQEMPFHLKRWKKKANWQAKLDLLHDFASKKDSNLFQFMRGKFNLDTIYYLKVNFNTNQGNVTFDSYPVDSGYNGFYFANKPYSITTEPSFGYTFSGWNNVSRSQKDTFYLKSDTVLSPVYIKNGKSNRYTKIRFNEVCYKDSIYSDYIEIYNTTDSLFDLSNWAIKSGDSIYYIKENTQLKPHSYFTFFKKKTKENSLIPNSEYGLFNVTPNSFLELYSEDEHLVDSIQLTKKAFGNTYKLERVASIVEEKWVSNTETSINKINEEQIKTNKLHNWTLIGLCVLVVLLILIPILIKRRKKRLHSSTE